MRLCARVLPLLLAAPLAWGQGSEQAADAILGFYESLDAYCDRVDLLDGQAVTSWSRCITKSGRYKYIEQAQTASQHRRVWWNDGGKVRFWATHAEGGALKTDHYTEQGSRDFPGLGQLDRLPLAVLQLFLPGAGSDRDGARRALLGYQALEREAGLQRHERRTRSSAGTDVVSRFWVREADGVIVRSETTWDGRTVRSAVLKSVQVNPPLAAMDLAMQAPATQRFSLRTRPAVFLGALAGAALISGFVVALGLPRGPPANWAKIWKAYGVAVGASAGLLALTALLALLDGGGHPPAIVIVIGFGIYVAIFLGAIALWLAGFRGGRRLRLPLPLPEDR